jgi:hypothetical protein
VIGVNNLLILGFRFFGHEIPEARLERARYVDGDKLGQVLRSMWRDGNGLVAVDVLERDSADDAEQTLQAVLRDVQSPLVARTETEGLGDVAYVAPGGGGVYFARANLVMIVRDAGDATSVVDAARALDSWVAAVPEPGGTLPPQISRVDVSDHGEIDFDITDPLERPVWVQLRTAEAQLSRRRGKAVLQPAHAAAVTVVAVGESGTAITEVPAAS